MTIRKIPSRLQAVSCSSYAIAVAILFLLVPSTVYSWLPPLSRLAIGNRIAGRPLYSSAEDEQATPDYTGKILFQRSLYELAEDSQVQLQNPLIIEERVRFRPDKEKPGFLVPHGPRTLIIREDYEDGADPLFAMNLFRPTDSDPFGDHDGPRSLDNEIASALYLAANPEWIQGDVLELSCADTPGAAGVAGILSCVASRFASMTDEERNAYKQKLEMMEDDPLNPSAGLDCDSFFPPRMRRLTLSEESTKSLEEISEIVERHFSYFSGTPPVSIRQLEWRYPRPPERGGYKPYRTILGTDLDLSVPTAKQLSKVVANSLLPSNDFAVANIKEGAETSPSFGGLGMDMAAPSKSAEEEGGVKVNPNIPAMFVHVCRDYRDETQYLRQFLENGYRMNVRTNYIKMNRMQLKLQSLPEDELEDEEAELNYLEGEIQEEMSQDYQSLTAVHHPEYAGDGTGDYFFPLENGSYEGGMSRWDERGSTRWTDKL